MRTLQREYGQEAFVSGQQKTINLPIDYAQADIMVEFKANITITDPGGGAAGTVSDHAPAGLVSSINIRANGSDVIKSFSLIDAIYQSQIRYGVLPLQSVMANGNVKAATDYYVTARIDFAMYGTVKPYDTVFNSKRLTSLQALIQFGSASDCYADAKGTMTTVVNSGTITLYGKEAVGIDPEAVFPVFKESTIASTVTATTSEFKIPLNYAQDLSYRALTLRGIVDGVSSNAILNNVKLQSGGVVFLNVNAARLRARNTLCAGLSMPTGCYEIDFAEGAHAALGRINDSLDTSGLSSLDLILDVTKSGTVSIVKVVTKEIIVPTVVKK
jgi:hypothetical protein